MIVIFIDHSEEFESLAISLGRDKPKLTAIKRDLLAKRTTAPLFDLTRYVRNLEAAYEIAYERAFRGEPLDHIEVVEANNMKDEL